MWALFVLWNRDMCEECLFPQSERLQINSHPSSITVNENQSVTQNLYSTYFYHLDSITLSSVMPEVCDTVRKLINTRFDEISLFSRKWNTCVVKSPLRSQHSKINSVLKTGENKEDIFSLTIFFRFSKNDNLETSRTTKRRREFLVMLIFDWSDLWKIWQGTVTAFSAIDSPQ